MNTATAVDQPCSPCIFQRSYRLLIKAGTLLQSPLLLAMRLYWGWQFFGTGKAKLMDHDKFTGFFQGWHIPFPSLSVYLAGGTECFGGLLLLAGLGSRLVCLPMIFTMIVAYSTAEIDVVKKIFDDPDKFVALCSKTPAVHRFPGSMAKRIQTLSQLVVDRYGGDAAALWTADDPDGAEVLRRIKELPGFGEQKAKIFLALLGKQYGVTPKGWREAAGDYGKAGAFMSVSDVKDAGSLEKVRSYKKQAKAAAKAAKA